MATKKIDYNARNFAEVRQQLISFIKQYYPETFSDFNDASVGMMLLELNAAVGDMLSFHTDRMFNETQINYAQEKSSLLELAIPKVICFVAPNKSSNCIFISANS